MHGRYQLAFNAATDCTHGAHYMILLGVTRCYKQRRNLWRIHRQTRSSARAAVYDEKMSMRLVQLGLVRLEWQRRVRSALIETFNIINGKYHLNCDLFFQLDEGGGRGHDQKLFKRRFIIYIIITIIIIIIIISFIRNKCNKQQSMLFVTELLTTGIHYLQVALIVILLTLLRSISRQHWNRELHSFYS